MYFLFCEYFDDHAYEAEQGHHSRLRNNNDHSQMTFQPFLLGARSPLQYNMVFQSASNQTSSKDPTVPSPTFSALFFAQFLQVL